MLNEERLKKTIARLRKINVPFVLIEMSEPNYSDAVSEVILDVCAEVGLMVTIEQEDSRLKIRNLFYSNN